VFNYSLVLNSVFSPQLTNQVLFGVNYFNQVFHDFNNSFDTKAMGLFLSPDAKVNEKPILGAPNIVIGDFEQIGLTPPEGRNDITGHLTDIVSYTMGKHQFRFGAEFRQGRVNEFYFRRGTGKFTFDGTRGDGTGGAWASADTVICNATCQALDAGTTKALADFLAGNVSSSTIAVGNAEREVLVNAYNLYFQDAFQVTRKLNMNYGLRYEYFGPLHSNGSQKDLATFIPGRPLVIQGAGIDSIFPPDRNNFAPRFGFAYQPSEGGDLVVRGGIGIFFDQINMNPFLDFRPPIAAASGLQGNPIGPSPYSTYSTDIFGNTSYNWQAVQTDPLNPTGSVFSGVTTCTTLDAATDPNCGTNLFNVFGVSQNFRAPYFYNYNLQVEKGLGSAAVFQAGYVGSQGRKLNIMLNLNQNAGSGGLGDLTGTYPNIGSALQLNSVGTSNYNALQTIFRIRTWHGLTSQVAYTWSHTMDEISEYRAVIPFDSFDIKNDYGNGDYDTRHLFTTTVSYEIPGSSHGPKILSHGWQVSALVNFHSGQPYDITRSGKDLIGDPFGGISHDFSKNLAVCGCAGVQWINTAAFSTPSSGIGNLARNTIHGPGFGDVDLSVFKTIPIRERVRVQLRAEMFNVFNRINLASGPGSVNGDGTVTDTIGDFNGAPGLGPGEAFNMQLAAKIIF
jgi:hypothetical protein